MSEIKLCKDCKNYRWSVMGPYFAKCDSDKRRMTTDPVSGKVDTVFCCIDRDERYDSIESTRCKSVGLLFELRPRPWWKFWGKV